MKVNRAGLEFTLLPDELYAAHLEWEHDIAYEFLYARLTGVYYEWACSLSGPSIEEVAEEAVGIFLKISNMIVQESGRMTMLLWRLWPNMP